MTAKQQSIYSVISSDILKLKSPPNKILKERELAIKYGTSRTTIRQTLQKLANEKKIEINPRSKTMVKKINIKKIKESILLRECIEQTVASLILSKIKKKHLERLYKVIESQKKLLQNYNRSKNSKYIALDDEFHAYIFEIAGLKAFWEIISEYNFDFNRLRHLAVINKKIAIASIKQHENIFFAIKEKKTRNIKKEIIKHFNYSRKTVSEYVKLYPNLID